MIDKINISATELPQSLNKVAKNKICFRGNDDNKLERTPQNDTVQILGEKNINQKFTIKIKENLFNKRTITGNYCGKNYSIIHDHKLFKPDSISGNIDNKQLHVNYDQNKDTFKGTIANQPIDMKFTKLDKEYGYKITGLFKDKNVDLVLNYDTNNHAYHIKGNNIDISMTNNLLQNKNVNIDIHTKDNNDNDLALILMSLVYELCSKEAQYAMIAANNEAAVAAYAAGVI